MDHLALEHPEAAARVAAALREGAVAIQLPSVYALLGAPTLEGAAALDRVKARRPGKTYSSFAGRPDAFLRLVRPGTLPDGIGPELLPSLVGAIVRCTVTDGSVHTPAVRGGTHQALFLDGPWRALAVALEAAWATRADEALYAGAAYSAVLATSLNESGHPAGSIVERARALAFAEARGVRLFVTAGPDSADAGSFPILSLGADGVRVERVGPGLAALLGRIGIEPARRSGG